MKATFKLGKQEERAENRKWRKMKSKKLKKTKEMKKRKKMKEENKKKGRRREKAILLERSFWKSAPIQSRRGLQLKRRDGEPGRILGGGFSDVNYPSRFHPPHPHSGDERRIKWPMARLMPKIYTAEIGLLKEVSKEGCSLAWWDLLPSSVTRVEKCWHKVPLGQVSCRINYF